MFHLLKALVGAGDSEVGNLGMWALSRCFHRRFPSDGAMKGGQRRIHTGSLRTPLLFVSRNVQHIKTGQDDSKSGKVVPQQESISILGILEHFWRILITTSEIAYPQNCTKLTKT